MGKVFFTSDLHFGHANIIRYDNRPFPSAHMMDKELVRRWNAKVQPDDTVYVLGDVSWHGIERTSELVASLNGHKILIRGNHDKSGMGVKCGFEAEYEYLEIKHPEDQTHIVLYHYPIMFFNCHHYGSVMLYGHVHNSHEFHITDSWKRELERLDVPCRMYNVGCMIWEYEPVTLEEIIKDPRFQKERPEGVE